MPSPKSSPSLPKEQRRRKVAFNISDNSLIEIGCVSFLSSDERRKIWYIREDYDFFKMSSAVIVRELRNNGIDLMLEGTYLSDASLQQNIKSQQLLKRWCRYGQFGRGMERRISPEHGKSRKLEIAQYMRTVLQTQVTVTGILDNDNRANELAGVAISLSENARVFALLMGRADAYAAEEIRKGKISTLQVASKSCCCLIGHDVNEGALPGMLLSKKSTSIPPRLQPTSRMI
jgi:hypothetical protein